MAIQDFLQLDGPEQALIVLLLGLARQPVELSVDSGESCSFGKGAWRMVMNGAAACHSRRMR